jgi:hypothetical protein
VANWRNTLGTFFEESNSGETENIKTPFEKFISEVAIPAFTELSQEFEKYGRKVTIRESASSAVIIVTDGNTEEIRYSLQERTFPDSTRPYALVRMRERGGLKLVTAEAVLRTGSDYKTEDLTSDEVIKSVLQHYTSRIKLR